MVAAVFLEATGNEGCGIFCDDMDGARLNCPAVLAARAARGGRNALRAVHFGFAVGSCEESLQSTIPKNALRPRQGIPFQITIAAVDRWEVEGGQMSRSNLGVRSRRSEDRAGMT